MSLAKSDEGRKMIEVGIHGDSEIVRTYTLSPATPKDRVQTLRKAFETTLKDAEFVAEAKKADLNINLVPGDEVEKIISGLFKLDPALVAKFKDVLYN
jgi:tripartite-type tricarboxylate transporter receptor subunit TctC